MITDKFPGRISVLFFFVAIQGLLSSPISAQGPKVLGDALQNLAEQITASVLQGSKAKVAILPFVQLDGSKSAFGSYIAEDLTTRLFKIGKVQVVERSLLDKLVGEIELSSTGLIDPETARKVGKVSGVDAIISGSLTELQTYVAINARLIDTETGLLFGAAQVKVVRDSDVLGFLSKDKQIEPRRTPKESRDGRQDASVDSGSQHMIEKAGGLTFELFGCKLSGAFVSCRLLITSHDEDRDISYSGGTRFFDQLGNEYYVYGRKIGAGAPITRLPADVPTAAIFTFAKVDQGAKEITALDLAFVVSGAPLPVRFRHVPLER